MRACSMAMAPFADSCGGCATRRGDTAGSHSEARNKARTTTTALRILKIQRRIDPSPDQDTQKPQFRFSPALFDPPRSRALAWKSADARSPPSENKEIGCNRAYEVRGGLPGERRPCCWVGLRWSCL